jgi:hypothetical protein
VLGTIGSHAFRAGRSLPDSRLLDRLMRGRAWIGLLGVLLIGLVALNVSLLKLNAQAGQNAEKAKALRIQNTQLRAKVSRLASAKRLERAGRELGLGMPVAGRVRYLVAHPGDGARAAHALRSPAGTAFAFAPLPVTPPPAPVAQAPSGATTAQPAGATGAAGAPAGATTPSTGVSPPATTGQPPATPTTQAPAPAPTAPASAGGAASPGG